MFMTIREFFIVLNMLPFRFVKALIIRGSVMKAIQKRVSSIVAFMLFASTIVMPIVTVDIYAYSLPDKGQEVSEKTKNAVKKGKDAALGKAKGVAGTVKDCYIKIDKKRFRRGWDHAVDIATSEAAAKISSEYIEKVGNEIELLRTDINASLGSKRDIAHEAGFVAEKWTAGTFNIDAAVKKSSSKASTPNSNKWASPDVATSYGEEASLKYYKTGTDSAREQAKATINKYREYKKSSKNPKDFSDYIEERGLDPNRIW